MTNPTDPSLGPDKPETSPRQSTALVLFVTTMVQALVTMNVVIPAAIAPEVAQAHGVPSSLIGLQIGLVYGGAMILSTLSGTSVRRWGAIRTSQTALILSAFGGAMMAMPSLFALIPGAMICGFGYALTNPPASHLLTRVSGGRGRNLLFSIKQTSVPLGGIAAGVMAPPVALTFGWQTALFVGAVTALIFAMAIQYIRATWDADRSPSISLRRNPASDMGIMWNDPRLRLFAFSAFCYSAVQLCLTTFAVTMLVTDLDFGLVEAGLVLAVLQVAGVTGRLWWGWLADKISDGNAVLLAIAVLSTATALVTTQLTPGTERLVVYGLLAIFSFGAVGWNGVAMAEIARLAPQGLISTATGAVLVVTFAGILVGPPVFTGLHSLIGDYTLTFGMFALISAIGGGFVLAARRQNSA